MKNIETLSKDVDSIKQEIEHLKLLVDQQEKEKKKVEIEQRISTVKEELDQKMEMLKDSTDSAEKAKYEEVKTLSESLTQLSALVMSILSNQSSHTSDNTETPSVTQEKSGRTKAKDWVGEQWGDVWSGDKWKNETGRNIARSVGFAATGYALYKWVKGLWNWISGDDKEKNENKEEKKEKKEKKGFWKTGFWKFVKWAGIGVGSFFGIRALTNRLSGDKDPETVQNPTNTVNDSRTDLLKENPDKAKQATEVWNAVNESWATTILQHPDGRLENDLLGETNDRDFIFDKAPGAIIANMEGQYASVEDLLDKSDYLSNMLQHAVNKPVYDIMSWGETKINGLLKSLAGKVKGILPSFRWSDGKLTEEGKKELAKPNPDRDQQLRNIFGKYMRVKLWYQVKLQQLRETLVKDQLWQHATAEDIEDYLDSEENRALVDAIIDIKFMKVWLIQASKFLEEKGVLDSATLPEHMQEVITDINDDYKKYRSPDIDKVLKDNEDPNNHKESLSSSCNDFIYNLQQPVVKRNLVEGIFHACGFDILANTTGVDIETIANQMGFNDIIKQYTAETLAISQKLSDGTATKEDIQHLNNLMNSFHMLQIEITLWWTVKNEAEGEGGFVSKVSTRFWEWALHFFVDEDGSINRSTVGLAAGAYVLRKPIVWVSKPVLKTLKPIGKWTVWWINPARYGLGRRALNALPTGSLLRAMKYRWGDKQLLRFQNDVDKGRISLKKAESIRPRIRGADVTKTPVKFDDYLQLMYPWKTIDEIKTLLKANKLASSANKVDDIVVDAMADIVKNHSFTGSLDNELSALKTEKDMLTDNNLIKKITKEMDYIETMKWELKTLKNVDELDALQMLWIQVKKSKKWPWEMLEFLRDVKRLLDTPEFRHLSKIEWDNLRVLKNSWNSEVIERVAKVMDDIRFKNLTKLTDNWFEAMTNWVKILIKFLAKAT